jgi:hypothetical protein
MELTISFYMPTIGLGYTSFEAKPRWTMKGPMQTKDDLPIFVYQDSLGLFSEQQKHFRTQRLLIFLRKS